MATTLEQSQGDLSLKKNQKESESIEAQEEVEMSPKEYYEMFNKLPVSAIVPYYEVMMQPGGVILSDENIHLVPFGFNMVPFKNLKYVVNAELQLLKQDAELGHAKVPLEVANNEALQVFQGLVNHCALCRKQAGSKCQSCMSVAYCCRDHQLAHWKDHRPFCVLHEIVGSTGGYHVVAKTNIKKGEAIFIEEPCIVIPFSTDEHFHLLKFQPVSEDNRKAKVGTLTVDEYEASVCKFPIVCLGCFNYINKEQSLLCVCECGWPICEKDCDKLAIHQQWECAYFKENGIFYDECRRLAVLCPRIFGLLRALLMKGSNSRKWDMLLDGPCEKIWTEKLKADEKIRLNIEYLLVVLRNVFLFKKLQYLELSRLLAVIDLKGMYGCAFDQLQEKCRRIISVYHNASLIRHRCFGNVFTISTNSGALHVIAARSIKKGEPLYRNHDIQGDLQHVSHRQLFAKSKGVHCECSLCVNVDAGDRRISAIVCLKCKRRGFESYMLAETPATEHSSWKCQRCSATKSSLQVQNLLQDITKDFEYYDNNLSTRAYENILRHCISKYKGIVLHQEHSVILAAEFDLIFYLMENDRMSSLYPEEMAYLMQLLDTRINILKTFLPDGHNSLVSMKMRMATVMAYQACSGYLNTSREILKRLEDLQLIHDDIAESFVENSMTNALQAYILICLRKMRKLICETAAAFNEKRREGNQSNKYPRIAASNS